MTYVNDPRDLNAKIAKVCDTVKNRALVFPGLIANRTDTAGFLQQGLTTWKSGTMGSVIFSSSILNLPQLEGLKHGPYRQPAFMTAEDKPVSAAQFIYKDFQRAAHTDWSDRVTDYHSHNLGIPAAGNPALSRIDSIAVELSHISDQSSKEELKAVAEEMAKLADNMRALPDSPYLKAHGKRAEYIINLLDQANMELGYAAYQAQFKDDNAQPLQVVDMPSSEQEKK
jgi:hypothetical protein